MPYCWKCGLWYDEPKIDDGMTLEEFREFFDTLSEEEQDTYGEDFDCGDTEHHLEVINETQKELLRGTIHEREFPEG